MTLLILSIFAARSASLLPAPLVASRVSEATLSLVYSRMFMARYTAVASHTIPLDNCLPLRLGQQ